MRRLRKKLTTVLLAGIMVVASMVPALAAYTDFTLNDHEYRGWVDYYDNGHWATAEVEHMCQYDCGCERDVSVYIKFYAIDAKTGGIETMIGYGYDEDVDYASTGYNMTTAERETYIPTSVSGTFWAYEGSESSFDELTIER